MTILTRDLHSLDASPSRSSFTVRAAGGGRRAFTRLLHRELADLSEGFRFRGTVLLILGLMIVSALINAARYRAEVRSYQAVLAEYQAELEGATVGELATIRHPAVKPPWNLAFLVDGGQSNRPNVYRQPLSPWLYPELESRHGGNRRLGPSEPLDWLFLIRVVFSLAAFVLSYDAFCGQRQRAALRMVLSYPVARWQVVASKALAIWLGLAMLFVIGAPWCLLILRTYGGISFTLPEWLKILQVSILGLWASAVFILIALLVSTLCRETARSLASLALIWITAVVVVPAAGSLLVPTMHPMPAGFETGERMAAIKEQAERDGPGNWRSWAIARSDNFAPERLAAHTQHQRHARQEALRRELVDRQFQQLQLARRLAAISPTSLIQDLAERCSGSGAYRDRSFRHQAWQFRRQLETYVEALDSADPKSPHVLFIRRFMSIRMIEAGEVPRFELREATVAEGIRHSARQLLALGLATLVLAAAVLAAFGREDVG